MNTLDGLKTPWRALFIGSGPLAPQVNAWSRRHEGRVRVQSGVAHDEVPSFMNAMDVLCAPSQSTARWREQFGRMLIEAFACGVPVLASNSGEIPHVVGDAGVLVDEGDAGAWLNELSVLLEAPARRADLSRRGRARAEVGVRLAGRCAAAPEFLRGAGAMTPFEPRLSIVIPTFNNVAVLTRCLESWETCASGEPIEIIVIEDGCRDETPQYLERVSRTAWGARHVRWFHEADLHELRCTNRGLEAARAPLAMAWQDDMFVRAPWFAPGDHRHVRCLRRSGTPEPQPWFELFALRRSDRAMGGSRRLAPAAEHNR